MEIVRFPAVSKKTTTKKMATASNSPPSQPKANRTFLPVLLPVHG